ncbi:MAG: ATP-binding protein [Eubacteriaceae bacterium]|jgi:anti-sigma regulatory factor (Ser/Thr protein kinase)
MKELALHILDITQNSIRAGATEVSVEIVENTIQDSLSIEITDNGSGIPKEMLEHITDPFVTSRTTRKVGLGLNLFQAGALACDGSFDIQSEPGKGTDVKAVYKRSHIDRAPLGNMPDTVVTMLMSFNGARLVYRHSLDGRMFCFDSQEIIDEVGDPELLTDPEILEWIRENIAEGLEDIQHPEKNTAADE